MQQQTQHQTQHLARKLVTESAIARAVSRAKAIKPHVRPVSPESYLVENSAANGVYDVAFIPRGNFWLATCNCKAGQSFACGLCFHIAAAAGHFFASRSVPPEPRISAMCEICSDAAGGSRAELERIGWELTPREQFCPEHAF